MKEIETIEFSEYFNLKDGNKMTFNERVDQLLKHDTATQIKFKNANELLEFVTSYKPID